MASARARHEYFVHFAHKTNGKRQSFESGDSVFERRHVIADLAQIFWTAFNGSSSFRGQKFPERRLRALDATGKHGFTLYEWPDEEVGVRQSPTFSGQASQQLIGVGQCPHEPRRPSQRRRQRFWMECPVSRQRFNPAAGGPLCDGTALFQFENGTEDYFNKVDAIEIVQLSVSDQTGESRDWSRNMI